MDILDIFTGLLAFPADMGEKAPKPSIITQIRNKGRIGKKKQRKRDHLVKKEEKRRD